MKVVFCSSEVFPFAKTGGLADVSGALPFALADKNCKVKVFMPLYKGISPQKVNDDFGITKINSNIEIIFIKNDSYFMRDSLYGTSAGDYPDNLERFSFYSQKVIEITKKMNFRPDIVHCNDWQASGVIIYLKTKYKDDSFFANSKTVLTVHNLAYQGLFDKDKFPVLGISWDYFSVPYLEYYGKINLLKGGIVFSDMVNTVSPTYARQVQDKEYGCGLDGVLKEKGSRLTGILNAIDYKVWNPSKDRFIYKRYSSAALDGKYVNKSRFQKEHGLTVKKGNFLIGMVSRLAEQKGIDILSKVLNSVLGKYQVVILGTGDEKYHKILKRKARKYRDSFSLHLKFDEGLAHRIYAGCDAFLMPSRFEPCGLSQMISYKYATVPIVNHTGGLVDTVMDYNDNGGGFVFNDYSGKALSKTIDRAYGVFCDKKRWSALLKKISKYNFSWAKTAQEYINMYKKCLSLP